MEVKLSKSIIEAFRGYFKMLAGNNNYHLPRVHAINLWAQRTSQLKAGVSIKGWTFANVWFGDKLKKNSFGF